MEELVIKYVVDKLPVVGALGILAYYMIKSQFMQLKREAENTKARFEMELENLRKEQAKCEVSCKSKIDGFNIDTRHLETAMNKGFEEVKIAIAEIRTEMKQYR